MSSLDSVQSAIAAAAERVGPSVVGLGRGWGLGSGVVIGEGHVLTSAHNLRRDGVTVSFADVRRARAEVAATDPDLDLAVLEVDTGDSPSIEWEPGDRPDRCSMYVSLYIPEPAASDSAKRHWDNNFNPLQRTILLHFVLKD